MVRGCRTGNDDLMQYEADFLLWRLRLFIVPSIDVGNVF
jgi:hypothetical protein